jgi:ribonuclease P protein component
LVFLVCDNGLGYARLGIAVKRSLGGAVERNRLKRRIREAFRRHPRGRTASVDMVVVVKRSSLDLDFRTIWAGMGAALGNGRS